MATAPDVANEASTTFADIRPSFPALAANMANLGRIGAIYHKSIEQVLVAWQVEEALGKISPEHRAALVEVHTKGRSYAEVAEEWGVPVGTIKSRVFYGLKALRLSLEELGWER